MKPTKLIPLLFAGALMSATPTKSNAQNFSAGPGKSRIHNNALKINRAGRIEKRRFLHPERKNRAGF